MNGDWDSNIPFHKNYASLQQSNEIFETAWLQK